MVTNRETPEQRSSRLGKALGVSVFAGVVSAVLSVAISFVIREIAKATGTDPSLSDESVAQGNSWLLFLTVGIAVAVLLISWLRANSALRTGRSLEIYWKVEFWPAIVSGGVAYAILGGLVTIAVM